MTDERNFRSSYYEKVGCRGVEEKKSLEILMKEKPWDKVKLKHFCLRFTVPAAYRNLVWKVLLDTLPVYPDSHEFVMEQRTEQYQDLLYAVEMLDIIDMKAPRSKILMEMWLLETEERTPPPFPETNFSSADTFLPIADALLELYEDEVDVYWFAKSLTDVVKNMQRDLPKLKEGTLSLLEKEDGEVYKHINITVLHNNKTDIMCREGKHTALQEVLPGEDYDSQRWLRFPRNLLATPSGYIRNYIGLSMDGHRLRFKDNHLVDINALELLPLTKWFNCCFAGVLDASSLAKIWDKVCSGAPKILSFTAVMLIITVRRNILRAKNSDEVLKCLSEISEQCEEVVANKAIDLWQYYGAQPQNDQLAKK